MNRPLILAACMAISGLSAFGHAQPRQAQEEKHPILKAIKEAVGKLRYSGQRDIEMTRNGRLIKMNEVVLRNGWNQRIEYSGGFLDGFVAVDSRDKRRLWDPKKNVVKEMPSMIEEPIYGFSSSSRSRSKITTRPGDKVAGLPTTEFEFRGESGGIIQKLWINVAQKMVLKREVYDREGAVLARSVFTKIDFNPSIPSDAFRLGPAGARRVSMEEDLATEARKLSIRPWILPQNKQTTLLGFRPMRDEAVKGLILSYRHKGERISFFQISGRLDPEKLRRMGGGRFSSHVWARDGQNFALVGGLPESDLKDLAGLVTRLGG